ncbi:hypothetical protein [Erythrobacter sp. JK5]|uniref:hypothetical protein n=1 Tax=Erythrobacter sp. JK5 TaxID=2829500 RepID=UPI001BA55923|nr:hypothetical protein [Erythrobacter sp. JK5]QUL37104.1 hypothetical protein KDC96_12000 [Erythrobacter sp. JK5]
MALIVLILLGAMVGWLASILARTEEASEILRQMALGVIASVVAGLFANSGTVLGGLSLLALGAASVAAVLAMIAYHMLLRRRIGV